MNKKSKIFLGGGLIIIIVAFLYVNNIFTNSPPPTNQKIKIGVITGLTGSYSALGESIKNSAILAVNDDPNIELIIEDSKFEVKTGLTVYKKLTDIDNVDYLILGDSLTFPAIMPLINEADLITFGLFESTDYKDDTIFQLMPFSYGLFSDLATEAGKRYEKIALVYANADLFIKNAEYFKQGISAEKIISETKLSSGADYKTEVSKILANNPDATTVILPSEDGIKFLKAIQSQIGTQKINIICDANMELAINQYISAVGENLLDGCISTMLKSANNIDFQTKYKAKFEQDPQFGADYTYDAINIIKIIKSLPKEKQLSYLKNISYDGVSGKIELDENGTRLSSTELRVLRNGKFETME